MRAKIFEDTVTQLRFSLDAARWKLALDNWDVARAEILAVFESARGASLR